MLEGRQANRGGLEFGLLDQFLAVFEDGNLQSVASRFLRCFVGEEIDERDNPAAVLEFAVGLNMAIRNGASTEKSDAEHGMNC